MMKMLRKLTKALSSWYDEREANRKAERTDRLYNRAVVVKSEVNSVVDSYRASGKAMDRRTHERVG